MANATKRRKKRKIRRRNPMVNYHNIKVQKGKTKRPTKGQIARYRVKSWYGGKGIQALFAVRKKAGPRGGKSVIASLRFPVSRWTLSKAKKYAKDHGFKIIKAEAARGSKKKAKKKKAKKKKVKKKKAKKAKKKKAKKKKAKKAKKKKAKKKAKKKTPKKATKCKKCKKPMRQSKGPGRPRLRHKRCAA